MHIDHIETPAVLIDLDKMEGNIQRLQDYMDEHGIANRPHIKTHKIPEIAHMQMHAGAVGIACQKIGEAEVMARAGLDDIFIPYNIMGEAKLERLGLLAKRINLSVTADSEYTVRGLPTAAKIANQELPVLIEFDTGGGRCGVQTPQEAADLARVIARTEGLHFGGLMTYPSNEKTAPFAEEVRQLLDKEGIPVEIVSGGGSPRMWETHTFPAVNEHRAGTYVYGDRAMVAYGCMTLEQCAMRILATVVSHPTADRVILDSGSKALSSDLLGQEDFGLILEYPDAKIYALNEEHGYTDVSACARKPEIGERVTIIPNHCCVVSNLFNEVLGVRNEQVEVVWPVAARGLLQ
jgi:D-serine deaminase-like pyridoxal phosphate-dependent protein